MSMHRLVAFAAATLILVPAASLIAAEEEGPREFIDLPAQAETVPDEYIVMLADDASPGEVARKHGVQARHEYKSALKGFAGKLNAKQLEDLKKDKRVKAIEPDMVVHAFAKRTPTVTAQALPTGIDRIDADLSPTAKINGLDERVNVDIAIIDTGVQKSHPDLNVTVQVNFSRERKVDDMNGHGTHVAGTAAAKDNGVGVVGVAPGARIWAVKVLDRNGSGLLSDVVRGVDYVTANAGSIEVANMSLGCECASLALNTALTRSVAAGVVYVVAAGNNAKDAASFSPANHPDVLAVSAIADFNGQPGGGAAPTCRSDSDDTFADFSNFGAVVDIAAPGTCIRSTWKGSTYATISGTSMASPHVAGAAALYLATHAKPTSSGGVLDVRFALTGTGTPQGSAEGFSGDPDGFAEPLVNPEGF